MPTFGQVSPYQRMNPFYGPAPNVFRSVDLMKYQPSERLFLSFSTITVTSFTSTGTSYSATTKLAATCTLTNPVFSICT